MCISKGILVTSQQIRGHLIMILTKKAHFSKKCRPFLTFLPIFTKMQISTAFLKKCAFFNQKAIFDQNFVRMCISKGILVTSKQIRDHLVTILTKKSHFSQKCRPFLTFLPIFTKMQISTAFLKNVHFLIKMQFLVRFL